MVRNLALMGVTTFSRILANVVVFVLMARLYGPNLFGEFMYFFALTNMLVVLVEYGFNQQILKVVGENPESVALRLNEYLNAKLLLAIVVVVASVIVLSFVNVGWQGIIIFYILLISAIFFSFGNHICAGIRASGYFHIESRLSVIGNAIFTMLGLLGVFLSKSLLLVSIFFLMSRMLFLLLCLHDYSKLKEFTPFSFRRLRENWMTLKHGIMYGVDVALTNIYANIDTLLVQATLGHYWVGIYQSGIRIVQGFYTFANILANAYIPILAKNRDNKKAFKRINRQLVILSVAFALVSSIVMVAFADFLIDVVFGQEFTELKEYAASFGVLLFARFVSSVPGIQLTVLGLQKHRTICTAISLIALIFGAWYALPMYGLSGMLAISVAGFAIMAFSMVYFVKRNKDVNQK